METSILTCFNLMKQSIQQVGVFIYNDIENIANI